MESSVCHPSPTNTFSYVQEENLGLTRKFVEHYCSYFLEYVYYPTKWSCTAPTEHDRVGLDLITPGGPRSVVGVLE